MVADGTHDKDYGMWLYFVIANRYCIDVIGNRAIQKNIRPEERSIVKVHSCSGHCIT